MPSFTVKISDEAVLKQAFPLWFQNAFDNHLWVLTQENSLQSEDSFAQIELKEDEIILITEHDASGITVVTNKQVFQQEEALRNVLAEAFQ